MRWSRCMSLLPRTTLHSDSEQCLYLKWHSAHFFNRRTSHETCAKSKRKQRGNTVSFLVIAKKASSTHQAYEVIKTVAAGWGEFSPEFLHLVERLDVPSQAVVEEALAHRGGPAHTTAAQSCTCAAHTTFMKQHNIMSKISTLKAGV